ncbi:hypothetical protein [Gemmata sp.]|uniref:hypothetical protein n=1 Tax=Gemmata sp. TaxID=1914242 RepID=UPI003F7078FD
MSNSPFEFGSPDQGGESGDAKPWERPKVNRGAKPPDREAKPQEASTGANMVGILAAVVSSAVVTGLMKSKDGAYWTGVLIGGGLVGAACGLIPLLAGRALGRPSLAGWGMGVCVLTGLLLGVTGAGPVAVLFALVIALLGQAREPGTRRRGARPVAESDDDIPIAEPVRAAPRRQTANRGPVWKVTGTDTDSGQVVSREIAADTEQEAVAFASLENIEVQSVERVAPDHIQ